MIPNKFSIPGFAGEINAKFMLTDRRNLKRAECYFKCIKSRQQTQCFRQFYFLNPLIRSCPTCTTCIICTVDCERLYNIRLYRQLQLHNGVQCLHFVVVKMSNIITNESATKGFPLSLLLDLIGGLKSHSIIYNQQCAELCSVCSEEINKIQSHLCN